jgi:HSP20 family molecular chaperone IbpA
MTSLSLWTRRDPFADFDDAFAGIIKRAFGPSIRTAHRPAGFVPAADLVREGDDAVVRLELPGLDPAKDVTVEIDRGRLVVKGERREERTENGSGTTLREVRYGSFQRTFGLPEHVDADAVSASYDAGVLTVRVTGAYTSPEPTARRIVISAAPTDESAEQPTDAGEQPSA